MKKRIESLDWLRGLMAISIMVYHLTGYIWEVSEGSVLAKLGVYGVSIFFTLSGLSMALVYHNKINNIKRLIAFWLKRIFRIAPLFFIVTTLSILPGLINGTYSGWKLYLFNISLLFGFFKPEAYIATGAWSIGNEMVYYLFTPLILLIYNFRRWLGNLLSILFCIIGLYFCFDVIDSANTIANQWVDYVNPFNNMFFFVIGISLYYNFKNTRINQKINILILLGIIISFILFPINNNIELITGWTRVCLSSMSIIVVFNFYKFNIDLSDYISYPLEKLGLATYGVYLLHPIVYKYLFLFNIDKHINPYMLFWIICIITIVLSLISYYRFEIKISKFGKIFINKYIQ